MKKILIFNKKKKEKKENNISFLEFLLLIIESRNAKTKFKYFNPTQVSSSQISPTRILFSFLC